MAGRIPQEFIDDLVSRVDIVEVINRRVPLKKKGREYSACCPFHDEKTPSFYVSPSKQFYHCFGCGAHGTALGFLMDYEHLDFVEAVESLAGQLGVEVPREAATLHLNGAHPHSASQATESTESGPPSKALYAVMERAALWFRQQLAPPAGQVAIDYLKGRGLSGEVAKTFGIGYAPPGWDGLLNALGDVPKAQLIATGLVIEKEENGKVYDRFRERVMFPIRDRRGRVIAFGGRVLGDGTPKYLNSPETPIFHKGRELYGLHEARMALRDLPRLLVVEGYMDVVALAQFDIRYAVATLGTATTTEHLDRLFRMVDEVVFCFDGDRAGRKAAWRALENGLEQMRDGRQVRFMFLPEGEDPDSLVRQIGRAGFEARIADAPPMSEFLINQLREQVDLSSLEGGARMVELAKPLLERLPQGAYRVMLQARLAEITRLDLRQVVQLLGKGPAPLRHNQVPPRARGPVRLTRTPLRDAIALLLQQPQLAPLAGGAVRFAGIEEPGMGLLRELLDLLEGRPHLTTAALLEHWRESEHARALYQLAELEVVPIDGEEAPDLERQFTDTLATLERQQRQRRLEQLSRIPFRRLSAQEREEYSRLLQQRGEN